MLAPIVAACGGAVPMISGRGLGHTGGTLDKLDSVPGYDTTPSTSTRAARASSADGGLRDRRPDRATSRPADRRLYAIRDATGTVESIPLIVASILSKKLAAGLDALVMDVKFGSGAFMAERADGRGAGAARWSRSRAAPGLPTVALLTDMDQVLGSTRRQRARGARVGRLPHGRRARAAAARGHARARRLAARPGRPARRRGRRARRRRARRWTPARPRSASRAWSPRSAARPTSSSARASTSPRAPVAPRGRARARGRRRGRWTAARSGSWSPGSAATARREADVIDPAVGLARDRARRRRGRPRPPAGRRPRARRGGRRRGGARRCARPCASASAAPDRAPAVAGRIDVIPKAELHVHLEGTAPPSLVRRLAERNGIPLPDGLFADEDTFRWTDFLDFLATYDMAASVDPHRRRTTATSPTSTSPRARPRAASTSS